MIGPGGSKPGQTDIDSTLSEKKAATFGMRAAALLVDLCLIILQWLFFIMLSGIVFLRSLPADFPALLNLILIFPFLLMVVPGFIIMSYFTILHAWGGQTVGKLCLGIRVVSCNQEQVSPGSAFLRLAGYLVSALPLAAGFIWAGLDKDHFTWHDKLAGTRVIIV